MTGEDDDEDEELGSAGEIEATNERPSLPSTSKSIHLVKPKPKQATTNLSGPIVTSFVDPTKSSSGFDASQKELKKAFMSSKISKVLGDGAEENPKKGKKRKLEEVEDAELESHLSQLDGQLSKLLALPSETSSSSDLLSKILAVPTPDAPAPKTPQKQVHSRTIIRSMEAHKHKRALKHDSMLDPSASKQDRQAKTLRERRKERGEDKQERGMRGAVGKLGRHGLKVSMEEIRRINGPKRAR
ncbi:hypothetical protein BT69DRAFT_1335593 [Atractiella rhizophila]|nr:hypothetical protein BT69DRAFT_1335593 [Atractiella rhizophila]